MGRGFKIMFTVVDFFTHPRSFAIPIIRNDFRMTRYADTVWNMENILVLLVYNKLKYRKVNIFLGIGFNVDDQ